ncbi:MAG: hypothetical protein R6U89_02450 [Dehalococcoidia bacterium]
MSYNLYVHSESDYLYIKLYGEARSSQAQEITSKVFEERLKYEHKKMIIDIRELSVPRQIVNAFHLVRSYPLPSSKAFWKTAVVERQENSQYSSFFENAARNQGHLLAVFYDREKAVEWLRNTE